MRYQPYPSVNRSTSQSLFIDILEERALLAGDIINISSDLDDFRFLAGELAPAIQNTYEVQVGSGATRVRFDLGGQTFIDNNAGDGWSATFDLSKSVRATDLVVKSFNSTGQLDSATHSVNLNMLPAWISSEQVSVNAFTVDSVSGYTIDLFAQESNFEVFTPNDWSWTLPYFTRPIVDISSLRTGFDSGWNLVIQSSRSGSVFVSDSSYEMNLEVLGRNVWHQELVLGTSGNIPENKWVTGTYSVALSPQLKNNLEWQAGISGSAAVNASLSREVHLPGFSLANANGLPDWLVDFKVTPKFDFSVGVDLKTNIGLDNSGFHINTLEIKPTVEVGLSASAGFSALLGAVNAGIEIGGKVTQSLALSYMPSTGWLKSAPGSMSFDGSLYWDPLFGKPSGKDLFDLEVSSWDFLSNGQSSPDVDSSGTKGYKEPEVVNNDPSSYVPATPTRRERTITVDASGNHTHGIEYYGVVVERKLGGEWKGVYRDFGFESNFEIGPLAVGDYRLKTAAINGLSGYGFGEWEYFYVPNVGPQAGNDVKLQSVTWSEDDSHNARNDGDWIPENREDVELSVLLKNDGDQEIRNVYAYLSSPENGIWVDDGNSYHGRLQVGESSEGTGFSLAFKFPGRTQGVPLTVYVEYMKGDQAYFQTLTFKHDVPSNGDFYHRFQVDGYVIDDSPNYRARNNGDGIFQSGERVRIRPLLKNIGNVEARAVTAEVTNLDTDFLQFERGRRESFPDLAPGSRAYLNAGEFFQVDTVDTRFVGKHAVDLRVWWADEGRYIDLDEAFVIDIQPAPNLRVSPSDIDVGNITPGSSKSFSFNVFNRGSETMIVSDIQVNNSAITFDATAFNVLPGQFRTVNGLINATEIPDGTQISELIRVISPNARISKPDYHDVLYLNGIVSDSVEIGILPGTIGGVSEPDISSKWMVWQEKIDGQTDVFAFNLKTQQKLQVTNEPQWQGDPMVSGDLVIWRESTTLEDGTWFAKVYGFDLAEPGLGKFPITESNAFEDIVGVDNGLVALREQYEELYRDDGTVDTKVYNLKVFEYQGSGVFAPRYSTGWTAKGSNDFSNRPSIDVNSESNIFNEGMLVFEQQIQEKYDKKSGGWAWSAASITIRKIDFAKGDSAPVSLNFRTQSRLAAGKHAILFTEEYEDPSNQQTSLEVFIWEDGTGVRRLTGTPGDNEDRGGDFLAIANGSVVYDLRVDGQTHLLYKDLADGKSRYLVRDVLTDQLRIDGNGVTWTDRYNGSDVFFAFLASPDLTIESEEVEIASGSPVIGKSIQYSVVVRNQSKFDFDGNLNIQVYLGSPAESGSLLTEKQLDGQQLAAAGQLLVTLDSFDLNQENGFEAPGNHELFFLIQPVGYDNPLNNLSKTIVRVEAAAQVLGRVDFSEVTTEVSGEKWLSVIAGRTGVLTILSRNSQDATHTDIEVYDANYALLEQQIGDSSEKRIDTEVIEGEKYLIRLIGSDAEALLTIANLVNRIGESVSIMGTSQADRFSFNANKRQLLVNGIAYDYSQVNALDFTISGGGSRDQVVVFGTERDEQVKLFAGSSEIVGSNFKLRTFSVEKNIVKSGGGNDKAWFRGWNGDDLFRAYSSKAIMTGGDYHNQAEGFIQTVAYATAGKDVARMFDSTGNDTYRANSNTVVMSGDGFNNRASGYMRTNAYSNSGNDKAVFYDSKDDDTFRAYENRAMFSGAGFFNWSRGFSNVRGNSTKGNDLAIMFDSAGRDVYTARPDKVEMKGADFVNAAIGFSNTNAYSRSGSDTGYFYDSDGADVYRTYSNRVSMIGPGYSLRANGFAQTTGYSTNGNDTVRMYDSAGDDVYRAGNRQVVMTGNGFQNAAEGFAKSFAYTNNGTDTAYVEDSAGSDQLIAEKDVINVVLSNTRLWLNDFDVVNATSKNGGVDTAAGDYLFQLNLFGPWQK